MTIPVRLVALMACFLAVPVSAAPPPAPNRWVELRKDPVGARPGSALRYAPDAGVFLLWGWMNADPDLLQEQPLMEVPEYDMVAFDLEAGVWRNHFPKAWEALWSKKLPLAYNPGTYAGKTSGSERIVLRGPTHHPGGAPRPDLNLVFDQVAYYSPGKSLFYFTGGLTAVYDVIARSWSDLKPPHSPPPVMGGTLAYDPIDGEMILFGGGHVAEPDSSGRLVGYTGTWAYSFRDGDWKRTGTGPQPPPRMNTRMVYDAKRRTLILFGGDAQSEYLADTWLFDLNTRRWRESKAAAAPLARAGHFTVYDPETGWVIVGGGYNRRDLGDMWAYDAGSDRWQRLAGEVPAGFYITADIDPEERTILLATSTRAQGDRMNCNILYPVRTTYAYRIDATNIAHPNQADVAPAPISKRPPEEWIRAAVPDPARQKVQEARLKSMSVNQWIYLADPGRIAPDRTWGSATFDSDRGRILYWGGEHCGYEGGDVDAYDVGLHTWLGTPSPEYPERAWDHGYSKDSSMGMCGVTFLGNPWNIHARRIYRYDPVSRKMIVVRPIRLTTGYVPAPLRDFPGEPRAHEDAIVNPPGSYDKWVTWSFDPDTVQWELLGPAPAHLDTLLTTKHGVIGVVTDWPWRLNDAGYQKPWSPSLPAQDTAVYHFNAANRRWTRLGSPQTSPQNLYEGTSLAYDATRDRIILHGGGKRRDEVWSFDLRTSRWQKLRGEVLGGGDPPVCSREAVYLPDADVFLTFNSSRTTPTSMPLWTYRPSEDRWYPVAIGPPSAEGRTSWNGQNRAMVYDPVRGLVLLVLGTGGSEGKTHVFALKYRQPAVERLAFERVVVDAGGPADVWLKAAGDLNGDERPDLIAGGRSGGGLVWYENPSWKKGMIAADGAFSTDGEVVDVDGDGDRDIVALTTKELVWFENPDWTPHRIDTVVLHDIEVADFDNDGRPDLAGRNQGAFGTHGNVLHLYRQQSPRDWTHTTIAIPDGEGILATDIDGDGDLDVVVGRVWAENTGKISDAWPLHQFGGNWTYPHTFVAAGDLNGDGRTDIVLAPAERAGASYRISWFEAPPDPKTGVWREHVVEDPVEAVHHFVGVADFDKDGQLDIATARMHQGKSPEIAVYSNAGAGNRWVKNVVAPTSSHSMRILDVDGDGLPDLYGANWQGHVVELWRNARR